MSGISSWRRLRAVLALVVVAVVVATASAAVVLAVNANPGPFTGCLSTKSTKTANTEKGVVYNVAIGNAPMQPCLSGDPLITFAGATGDSAGSVSCTTPVGPGDVQVTTTTAVASGTDRQGFQSAVVCVPRNARHLQLNLLNLGGAHGSLSISPAPLLGTTSCTEYTFDCGGWIAPSTSVTITATGNVSSTSEWADTGCAVGASTCTFTMDHDRSIVVMFVP